MSPVFTETQLAMHIYGRLANPRDLAPHIGPLYDPAVSIPTGQAPPVTPGSVFGAISDPYARRLETAYVQMTQFANAWWLPLSGIVDAEPLFEWLMHTDFYEPRYRDHIVHQARVAAIGDVLLDRLEVDGQTILERAVVAVATRLEDLPDPPEEIVRLAWWLGAMFHDCGYPYQHHQNTFRHLHDSYRVTIGAPTDGSWFQCYLHLAELTDGLSIADIANSETAQHAFTGAAELAAQEAAYEAFAGTGENKGCRNLRRAILALAVRSVRTHHWPEKGGVRNLRFEDEPLAWLLVLSDELHEMERPCGIPYAYPAPAGLNQTTIGFDIGPIRQVELNVGGPAPGGGPILELVFHCQPGTTRIRGKSKADWVTGKRETLTRSLLFGASELFEDVTVSVP